MKGRDTKEGLYVRGYMRKLGLAKLPLNFFWDKVETGSMNPTLGEESGWKGDGNTVSRQMTPEARCVREVL